MAKVFNADGMSIYIVTPSLWRVASIDARSCMCVKAMVLCSTCFHGLEGQKQILICCLPWCLPARSFAMSSSKLRIRFERQCWRYCWGRVEIDKHDAWFSCTQLPALQHTVAGRGRPQPVAQPAATGADSLASSTVLNSALNALCLSIGNCSLVTRLRRTQHSSAVPRLPLLL